MEKEFSLEESILPKKGKERLIEMDDFIVKDLSKNDDELNQMKKKKKKKEEKRSL